MSAIMLITGLILGMIIGVAIGYLYAGRRLASATERARAAEERAALVDGQLAERFQSLPAQALDASAARFLDLAEGRLENRQAAVEHLVGPLKETLTRLEAQLHESDAARRASHAALAEQVNISRHTTEQLRNQTQALVTALRRPEARGRWGELQLRRVAELAGMAARCDFDEQVAVAGENGGQRPDMVVRLAGGKNIVVDAKAAEAASLEEVQSNHESVSV